MPLLSRALYLASLLIAFLPAIQAAGIPISNAASISTLGKRYALGKCSVYVRQKLYKYTSQDPEPSDFKLLTSIQLYDDAKSQIGGDDTLRDTVLGKDNSEFSQLPFVMIYSLVSTPTSTSHAEVRFRYGGDSWTSADGRCTSDAFVFDVDSAGPFTKGGVRCSLPCGNPPAPPTKAAVVPRSTML